MATLSKGTTYTDGASVTHGNLNALVDSATISGIVNADIDAGAAIAPTKLAQITTASKVSGAALTLLPNIPSGAGVIPVANLGSGSPGATNFLRGDGAFEALTTAELPAGTCVQRYFKMLGTQANGANSVPLDNTTPAVGEMNLFITCDAYTPKSATNILVITVMLNISSSASANLCCGLSVDGGSTICAISKELAYAAYSMTVPLRFCMVAGSTDAKTIKVYGAGATTGTTYLNGDQTTALFNGIYYSTVTIEEYVA